MDYIELRCEINPKEAYQDILIAELANIGYEGFVEEEECILAYIPQNEYNENLLAGISLWENENVLCTFTPAKVVQQNWNALWEKDYEPVVVDGICGIRADFHPQNTELIYDIIINPKMSFGTAHHETTRLMLSLLLNSAVKGEEVLDMGCGTGVLAILADKMGASSVIAIDNDEWAVNNSSENVRLNNSNNIKVKEGDASVIGQMKFSLILANINRNILLHDMEIYRDALKPDGLLFLSGFYSEDFEAINKLAGSLNLVHQRNLNLNNWIAAEFLYPSVK